MTVKDNNSSLERACMFTVFVTCMSVLWGLYFSKALFEGLIFGGAYIRRGLSMEGNLHFEIDWDSLIVASKFTVFALFYFLFEGNFPNTSPRGAYFWRGDLTEGFLHYDFGGLIFGAAYTWRGLFSEFYGNTKSGGVSMEKSPK